MSVVGGVDLFLFSCCVLSGGSFFENIRKANPRERENLGRKREFEGFCDDSNLWRVFTVYSVSIERKRERL